MTFFIVAIVLWVIMVVIAAIHCPQGLEIEEHMFLALLAAFWPVTLLLLGIYLLGSGLTWVVHKMIGRY